MKEIPFTTTGNAYTNNICGPFFDRARRNPESIALVYEDCTYRFADVVAQVDTTIDLLLKCGIKRGDRVAFIGQNHPATIVVLFALTRIGAVHLPLNPRCSAAEVKFITNDADVSTVIVGPDFQQMVDGIRGGLPCSNCIGIEEAPQDWSILSIKDVTGSTGLSRHKAVDTDKDSLAIMLYTSGTTGTPKGVMITHSMVSATSTNLDLNFRMNNQTSMLAMAPMFHISALAMALPALSAGGKLVLMPGFTPDDVYHALSTWQITLTFAVPTMLLALENHPRFADHDFSILTIVAGGAPIPVAMLRTWLGRGAQIVQGYGMTEGGGTMLEAAKALEKVGSAGMPLPLTEIQIRDLESNLPVFESEIEGQIFMKGPAVFRGYWNRPEETATAVDAEGWLATGDIGRWDDDGCIYIVDRLKDMIITGGMNVYPAELEKVLCDHPQVEMAAVVGLPDDKWGEQVTALIVSNGNNPIEEEELLAYCCETMSNYKVPQQFEFYESFPVGPSGKVLKRQLREELLE
ncbi:MAG: AMP-binding protein [Gammaproteobacteria bacterium]|nr:AMP-binding protein [Gammaproteobacteria bacterium]